MFIYTKFQMPGRESRPVADRSRPSTSRPLRPVRTARPDVPPQHGTQAFRVWSLWLGHRLAEEGTTALEEHLAVFAATALELGVDRGSVMVLTDTTESDVARSRAFFRVATSLDELALGDDIAAA